MGQANIELNLTLSFPNPWEGTWTTQQLLHFHANGIFEKECPFECTAGKSHLVTKSNRMGNMPMVLMLFVPRTRFSHEAGGSIKSSVQVAVNMVLDIKDNLMDPESAALSMAAALNEEQGAQKMIRFVEKKYFKLYHFAMELSEFLVCYLTMSYLQLLLYTCFEIFDSFWSKKGQMCRTD